MGGVKAGEELLVEYGYNKRGGPQWWKEGKKKWKVEEAAREKQPGKADGMDRARTADVAAKEHRGATSAKDSSEQ